MSDILRWETRKTRKPHRCFGCNRVYPAGTPMVSAAYADHSSVYSCYWCGTCEAMMNQTFEQWDEVFRYGDVRDSDPDLWEEIKATLTKEATP